jgi:hypothetical protein
MKMRAAASESVRNEGDWIAAMRAGDFARAWAINDRDLARSCASRPEKHGGPRHEQRIWRGEDLRSRRVLVRCYHGLGDTIQFVRFMPALREIADEVIVWCQPQLLPLIERVAGVDRALPLHDGTPEVEFDVDIEIMEVPHALRAGDDLVAMRQPYLSLPQTGAPARLGLTGDLSIGLVWEAGDWDRRRSVPAALLGQLGEEGVQLYALQRGPAADAAAAVGASDISTPGICTLGHQLRQLDLVICVDTMVAHLAGALGCPTWVLLHSECDWRWPASGASSLWYPSLRLFHRRSPGQWESVIEDVWLALRNRIGKARVVHQMING